jgi:hypothetical protein
VGHSKETFSFTVGDYNCIASALSIGEYNSLVEGALPFPPYFTCEQKEQVIFSCLVEPAKLIDAIKEGSILFGIPEFVFNYILSSSGFDMSTDEREAVLSEDRGASNTDVISSCKAMILASGIMGLDELEHLTFRQLLRNVALAEQVLFIQQQNMMAAVIASAPGGEGQQLKLSWEEQDTETQIVQQHMEKQAEVDQLLQEQTSGRIGRGVRRL